MGVPSITNKMVQKEGRVLQTALRKGASVTRQRVFTELEKKLCICALFPGLEGGKEEVPLEVN